MPNWAEGNIRLRGKRENIIHFLTSELIATDKTYDTLRTLQAEDNCGGWTIILRKPENTNNDLYFRGSDRQFIMDFEDDLEFEMSEGKNKNLDQVVVLNGFHGAWCIDESIFKRYAMKYKIDIRIFVWERGMGWSSVRTFYKDGHDDGFTKQYADWLWDSPLPYYGG